MKNDSHEVNKNIKNKNLKITQSIYLFYFFYRIFTISIHVWKMFQHDTYVIKQQSHTHEQYELQHGYPTIPIVYVSLAKINLRVLDNVKNRVFNISILSKPLI